MHFHDFAAGTSDPHANCFREWPAPRPKYRCCNHLVYLKWDYLFCGGCTSPRKLILNCMIVFFRTACVCGFVRGWARPFQKLWFGSCACCLMGSPPSLALVGSCTSSWTPSHQWVDVTFARKKSNWILLVTVRKLKSGWGAKKHGKHIFKPCPP